MSQLSSFQYTLLAAIVKLEDPSGQDIRRYLQDTGEVALDTINHGRLYPNLDTLVENQLVKKTVSDDRTNAYVPNDSAFESLEQRASYLAPNSR